MSLMVRIYTMVIAAALALGSGVAIAQTPASLVLTLNDAPDGEISHVGNPTNWGYVILNEDGTSNVHKNGQLRISQNGVLLYETQGISNGHDYDALNPVFFAFPRQGPYEVLSHVPLSAALTINKTVTGYAVQPVNVVAAKIDPEEIPGSSIVGETSRYVYSVKTESGELIPHSQAIFEIRRASDNWLVFRTHTHSHLESMVLDYAFAQPGEYLIKIVGYQASVTKTGLAFEPVAYSTKVTAQVEPPINAPKAAAKPATPPAASSDASGDYMLVLTSDPPAAAGGAPANVGLFGNVRLNALVFDKVNQTLVPHINLEATITNALGEVRFKSASLHEYDGHLEVVDQEGIPGTYTYTVTASRGDYKETKSIQFSVTPVVVNAQPGVGPTIVTAKGLDGIKAGVPQLIEFTASTAAGTPHGHAEIDLQVMKGGADGVPLLINKIHSHGDGKFAVKITFPDEGDYTLVLDPETVHADPTPRYYFGSIGTVPIVPLKVTPGVELPSVPFAGVFGDAETVQPAAQSPLPVFVALAAIGVALLVRRRAE